MTKSPFKSEEIKIHLGSSNVWVDFSPSKILAEFLLFDVVKKGIAAQADQGSFLFEMAMLQNKKNQENSLDEKIFTSTDPKDEFKKEKVAQNLVSRLNELSSKELGVLYRKVAKKFIAKRTSAEEFNEMVGKFFENLRSIESVRKGDKILANGSTMTYYNQGTRQKKNPYFKSKLSNGKIGLIEMPFSKGGADSAQKIFGNLYVFSTEGKTEPLKGDSIKAKDAVLNIIHAYAQGTKQNIVDILYFGSKKNQEIYRGEIEAENSQFKIDLGLVQGHLEGCFKFMSFSDLLAIKDHGLPAYTASQRFRDLTADIAADQVSQVKKMQEERAKAEVAPQDFSEDDISESGRATPETALEPEYTPDSPRHSVDASPEEIARREAKLAAARKNLKRGYEARLRGYDSDPGSDIEIEGLPTSLDGDDGQDWVVDL